VYPSKPIWARHREKCISLGGVTDLRRGRAAPKINARIRTNPGVFARLRSFAFNILKANQTDTLSQDRYRAGLAGIKKLLRMLTVS